MKKLIGICLAVLVAVSVICPVAKADTANEYGGTNYYIDSQNGDSSNTGTSESAPLKALTAVLIRKLQPGDKVLLKRGSTFQTSGYEIITSGTAEKPITFSCYGDEKDPLPLISGFNSTSKQAVVIVSNQSYVTIDSLNITSNYTGTSSKCAIKIEAADGNTVCGVSVTNCVIDGASGVWESSQASAFVGISVAAKDYWGYFNGITIENNEIYNCKATGLSVNGCAGGCNKNGVPNEKSGKNIVIRNNFLYNIGKDGIVTNNCNAPIIEYNTCGRAHSYAKTTWHVAMWPFACYKALFQYNESYETQTVYDGQGFDCDYLCYYTTFQYNYSHDNTGGFMLICTEPQASWLSDPTAYNVGSVVRYNISQNDLYRIFTLVHHITDTKIYNNTIYAEDGVNHIVYTTAHNDKTKNPINTLFYNNIFYTAEGDFEWLSSIGTEFKNNIVYGANSELYPQNDDEEYYDDDITSSGNIFDDPLLAHAGYAEKGRESCYVYKLLKGSPAINAGLVIDDESNTLDFFGNSVSKDKAPNIGAYNGEAIEFKSGDSDYDGEVTLKDALNVIKYIVKAQDESKINFEYADYNGDNKIDVKDVLYLKIELANAK